MGTEQWRELKRLQREKERRRRAVSDLTLAKLILPAASRGNFCALPVGAPAALQCAALCTCLNGVSAGLWARLGRRTGGGRAAVPMHTAGSQTCSIFRKIKISFLLRSGASRQRRAGGEGGRAAMEICRRALLIDARVRPTVGSEGNQ